MSGWLAWWDSAKANRQNLIQTMTIIEWYYHQKAKRKLLSTKREELEVLRILENYLTERIIEGQQQRRPELGDMQKKIEELEKFLKFMKKL